jgi:DNA-directed RNA polymerase specialized sigma24 family protein
MPGGADQRSVDLSQEQLLRKFVACRDAGDGDGALHWWGRLVGANLDRVRGMVDVRASRYGLSADEREEAVQRALVKLWHKMVATFRGSTMGEWVNATKTLVEYVCKDVQRSAAKQSAHETSLHAQFDDPDDDGADWLGDELALQWYAGEQERVDAADFVTWALPQIADGRRRLVLERTLDGVPAEDIAAELDVTMANLYAIRSRAVKDMRKLHEWWYGA